nr:hypothetical protein [uncultured Cohaesibacter sp.]
MANRTKSIGRHLRKIFGLQSKEDLAREAAKRQWKKDIVVAAQWVQPLVELLRPVSVEGCELIRIGNEAGDGGYVCADPKGRVDAAYSLGISDEVSWDEDIVSMSIPVYQFDCTIAEGPMKHELVTFYKECLGTFNGKKVTSIEEALVRHDHLDNDRLFLKMDIEGGEWSILDYIAEQDHPNFWQIACEFHDLCNPNVMMRFFELMKKLSVHYYVIHVHANNAGKMKPIGEVEFPELLEVTFLRRDGRAAQPCSVRRDLDHPNVPNNRDLSTEHLW